MRPTAEIEWKVKHLLPKFSDGSRMSYGQRFGFNTFQQRYALYNSLWQQKLLIKEEGYRQPQDAILGIQGLREEQEHEAKLARQRHGGGSPQPFTVACSDADSESSSRVPVPRPGGSPPKNRRERTPRTSIPSESSTGKTLNSSERNTAARP